MANVKHIVEYLLAKAGYAVANRLSDRIADNFAVMLGNLGFRLMNSRRAVAIDNLRQAFGSEFNDEQTGDITRKVFQNIARTLIEIARFGRTGEEGVRRIVVGDGEKYLRQAREYGKGALLLTAHFGNWELLGAWVSAVGYQIDHLVGVQHNPRMHSLINHWRQQMGAGVIEVNRSSMRRVFQSLKANRLIGYAADQHAPAQNLVLDFFGRRASIAAGPARFAVRTGCLILPMMLRREKYDRHILIAREPIRPPHTGDEEENVLTITRTYLAFWEEIIRQYPDQWLWTHRRWKM
ncbi:MAG: lysophospholipid acyltransferase family protein [Candidatus Zixiibacteriota bacterium]|nr:MAG: lysophospholipid acyltransferase family protein [candidate division Zixibacteria bacterium]